MGNQMVDKKIRLTAIRFLAALILILLIANTAVAAYPEPTYGKATVDGNPIEWDLANDFFANMYNQGNPDPTFNGFDVLSKLYLRYDCSDETLYALVLLNDLNNDALDDTLDEQWIKVYSLDKILDGNLDGNSLAFKYIYSGSRIIGWEGSGKIKPGTYTNDFQAHAQMSNGDTSSTGKPNYISLKLNCNPIPEFPTIAVPVIMVLGIMFFFQRRK